MKYLATISFDGNILSKEFFSMEQAAEWLDSQNTNLEATATIETISDAGYKTGQRTIKRQVNALEPIKKRPSV